MLAMVLGQGAMALSRHRDQLLAWLAGAVVLAVITLGPGAARLRVEAAYALSSLAVACALALVLFLRTRGQPGPGTGRSGPGPAGQIQSVCRGQASRVSTTSGGPSAARAAVTVNGRGRTAAAAPAPAVAELGDPADHHVVVTGLVHGLDAAASPGERAVQDGRPGRRRRPAHAVEFARPAGAEHPGQLALLVGQHVGAEVPGRAIRGQVADERPGQNSTSGGSRDSAANDWQAKPAGPPASTVGDDRDTGAEVAEHLAEPGRLWLGPRRA